MRALAAFIMRSPWHAMAATGLLGLLTMLLPVPPIAYLSGAALSLCVLRRGFVEALRVLAGAAVLLGLVSVLVRRDVLYPLAMLVISWLPALALAGVMARTASPGRMILAAFALAAAGLVLVHLRVEDLAAGWLRWLDALEAALPAELAIELDEQTVRAQAWLMTGMLASIYAAGFVLTVFIGRWWQALLYRPGGFREEFHGLSLPPAMLGLALPLVLMAGLELAMSGPALAAEVLLVALTMYMFQGLAVMHFQVGAERMHRIWLIVVYLAILLLQQRAIFALGFLGMMDTLFDFRRLRQGGGT